MVNNINTLTQNNFYAKATKFKELTGREIVIEKNNNGDFVHMLHPESTQRLGFMIDFFRIGFNSPEGFETAIENLSRRYAELRDEILEKYSDNKDELYKQLSDLNQTFENALQSTVLLPLQNPLNENYENISGFMQTLKQNKIRHLNNFFEAFIKSIKSADFDTAFANTIESINSGESQSLSNMSFRDTVLLRDILHQGSFAKEERNGESHEVFIFTQPSVSLRQAITNTNISSVVRQELANLFQ